MEIGNREKVGKKAFSTIEAECLPKQADEYKSVEKRLEQDGWKTFVRGITLPQRRKESIMERVKASQTEKVRGLKTNPPVMSKALHRMRYTKLVPAAVCMLLILAMAGMTARAVYVNRHLNVFFEKDITAEQMHDIEKELMQMEGIVSCRYIDEDTAWKTFGEDYLTPELMESFTENPLADSASFKVGISLDADAEQTKARIGELDGVRLVSGLWEE